MSKISRWFEKNGFMFILVSLGVLNVLPFLAPVFVHLGWHFPAKAIYTVYSFFCHQLHWRSLHIYDHQCAWCTRCTFIWLAVFIVAVLVKNFGLKPARWYWFGVYLIPIAIDGLVQTAATLLGFFKGEIFYISSNFMRMLSGAWFGTGVGLFMITNLGESFGIKPKQVKSRIISKLMKIKYPRAFLSLSLLFVLLIFYIISVFVWKETGKEYPPDNIIDLSVRMPESNEEWLVRGKNAEYFEFYKVNEIFK